MLFYEIPSVCTVQVPARQFKLQTTGELGCDPSFAFDCSSVAPLGATCDQNGIIPDVTVRYFVSQTPCSEIGSGADCSVDIDSTLLSAANCFSAFSMSSQDCGGGCYVEVFCQSFFLSGGGSTECPNLSDAQVTCSVLGSCSTGVTDIT